MKSFIVLTFYESKIKTNFILRIFLNRITKIVIYFLKNIFKI
jgi:hypothetical protein